LQADDQAGRVITLYSLSRSLFRSLRLAYMALPSGLMKAVLEARAATDAFEPLPNQLILRDFIDRGLWSAHQRRCRELHQERRDALIAALDPYLGTLFVKRLNPCGLHLRLTPIRHPADEIADALRSAGIACSTLAGITRGVPLEEGILLGFAAFSPDVIEATRPALDSALRRFT
jgi:GntR family transcriptional regulator/MocR family aminotransferase